MVDYGCRRVLAQHITIIINLGRRPCCKQKTTDKNQSFVSSEADSNRCTSFCRPLPSHSAIRPKFRFRFANIQTFIQSAKFIAKFRKKRGNFCRNCPDSPLKLRCEVEFDIRELLLCKRQSIACIGKEYITIVLVLCHIGVLATLEVC